MHSKILTTLLIPLLLSSVLAAPTPMKTDNANNGGALVVRRCTGLDCTNTETMNVPETAEEQDCDPGLSYNQGQCDIDQENDSMDQAQAEGEDPLMTGP